MLLTVKKASNLPASDDNGLADPYVRLTLDTKRHTTKIKPKTLAPEWNESFEWSNVRPTPVSRLPRSLVLYTPVCETLLAFH